MANEVFISYSRRNYGQVYKIKEEIDRKVGIDCWMDIDGIESGEQFLKVIVSAINRHDTFLFMLSKESMQSEWALDELDLAQKNKKRVILVNIDSSEMTDTFYFKYHKYDNILWSDSLQHDKLLRNLKAWFHKEKETAEEARRKVEEEAKETAFWKRCSPNSISQLQEYIRKYPNGMYITRAKSLIANLERIEKDAIEESRMYNQCRTRIDYMDYLRKYPNGLHKAQAQAKIKEFDKVAAQERAAYVQEKNIYEQCKTKDDYLQYISLYPNGLYANQARNKIAHLEKKHGEHGGGNTQITDSDSKATLENDKKQKKASVKEIMVFLISAIALYVLAYSIRDNYENLGPFLCLVSYFPYMLFAFEVVSNKKLGMVICITGWFVMMFFWSDYATQPTQSILPALGILGICSFFAVVAYFSLYREE